MNGSTLTLGLVAGLAVAGAARRRGSAATSEASARAAALEETQARLDAEVDARQAKLDAARRKPITDDPDWDEWLAHLAQQVEKARAAAAAHRALRQASTAGDAVGRDFALQSAEALMDAIHAAGGPRLRVWSKPGTGVRVYFPGEIGYLSVGQDGSVSETSRGKLHFNESGLYPAWRKAVREGRRVYLEQLGERLQGRRGSRSSRPEGHIRVWHGTGSTFRTPRAPAFFTTSREGAAWFARERSEDGVGRVVQFQIDVARPANRDDLLRVARDAGVEMEEDPYFYAPEIQKHSRYGGDNPLDLVYIPRVRQALLKAGFDGVRAWDLLESSEIEAWITLRDDQARPVRSRRGSAERVDLSDFVVSRDPSKLPSHLSDHYLPVDAPAAFQEARDRLERSGIRLGARVGVGTAATVYAQKGDPSRVIKLTFDPTDAASMRQLVGGPSQRRGLPDVDAVYDLGPLTQISSTGRALRPYAIVLERLAPIPRSEAKRMEQLSRMIYGVCYDAVTPQERSRLLEKARAHYQTRLHDCRRAQQEGLTQMDCDQIGVRETEVIDALDWMQQRGYCSLDIGGKNVMQRADGGWVISDFGYARANDAAGPQIADLQRRGATSR